MANAQTRASAEYRKRQGIISKNYKLKKELCDEFAKACGAAGISQTEAIKGFMIGFIKEHQPQEKAGE